MKAAVDAVAFAVGLGWFALICGSVLGGCGASALTTHTRVVGLSRVVINTAAGFEESAIAAARDACPDLEPAHSSCVADVERAADIIGSAHEVAVHSLAGYETSVRAAVQIDGGEEVLAVLASAGAGVLARALAIVDLLAELLRFAVPPEVRAILATVIALLDSLAPPQGAQAAAQ